MTKAALEIVLTFTTQASLAKLFNISPAAVSQWRITGIPPNRVIDIEVFLEKQVTRYEMRPDIYPPE